MSRIKLKVVKRIINNHSPIFILLIIITLLFAKVLFPPDGKIIYGGDILTQFYYWKGYLAENIKQGVIPFWNPYNFSGTPFLAHPSTAFFYPANLIFYIMPLNLAFSWFIFAHFVVAGVGMYLLGKFYGDKFGALTAPSIFVLSGFFSSRVYAGHIDILSTAAWIPWVFWGAVRYLNKPSFMRLFLFILFFSLEILSGYQAFSLFTIMMILIYIFIQFFKNKNGSYLNIKTIPRKYFPLLLSIFFSLGITSVQWLPTTELIANSIRKDGLPYGVASWGSLPVSGLKLFIDPFDKNQLAKLSYGFIDGPLPNFFDYYLGTIPVILLLIISLLLLLGKISAKINQIKNIYFKERFADFWPFVIIALIFLYISFGHFATPNLHGILYRIVPFYRYFRIPDQHLVIFVFSISVLCAISVSNIRSYILKSLITILIIGQLLIYSQRFFILTDIPKNQEPVNRTITENGILYRFLPSYRVFDPLKNVFDFNSAMLNKSFSVSGYDPIILYDYYRFIDLSNKNKDMNSSLTQYNVELPPVNLSTSLIKILGIKYLLGGNPLNQTEYPADSYEIIDKTDQYSLLRIRSVQPRFFQVGAAKFYRTESEVTADLLKENTDLTKEVLIIDSDLKKPEQFSNSGCNKLNNYKIDINSYKINSVELSISTDCDGFLVTSESYYPGWKAEIDGKITYIYKSNLAFRSIYLPKGIHRVKFYYSGKIYYLGFTVSIISGLIFYFYFQYRRKLRSKINQFL